MKSGVLLMMLAGVASCADQFSPSSLTGVQVENSSLDCPFSQPIAIATVLDVKDGVAIDFSGPVRAVDLIRANVHTMKYASASQGDPFSVCPCGSDAPRYGLAGLASADSAYAPPLDPSASPSADEASPAQTPVPANASMDETPLGALLVLKPKDPRKLQSLRVQVRANVAAMETACVRAL